MTNANAAKKTASKQPQPQPQVIYKTVYVKEPAQKITWPPFVRVVVDRAIVHNNPVDDDCGSIARTPQGSGWRVIGEDGEYWKVEAFIAKGDCRAETQG